MAKGNNSSRVPQPRHGKKSVPSRHDKRLRLGRSNPHRKRTQAATIPLVGPFRELAAALQSCLDARMAFRFSIILAGALLAKGRRTASSWFRAAGVGDDWDLFYDALTSIGKRTYTLALPLLRLMVRRWDPGAEGYWVLGIDDSPTKRYGRHVEGANIHHNPTAGPADSEWLYGHNWVSVALLKCHAHWGVIALPILSELYVRLADVAALKRRGGWKFRTKLELAARMMTRIVGAIRGLGSLARIIAVVDGAYAAAPLLKPLAALSVTVISRLRRNASLFDLPSPPTPGRRARPRVYDKNRISLAKRAGHRKGWESLTYRRRRVEVTHQFKTFLATSKLTSGIIRVVIVKFAEHQWAAFFSTDPDLEPRQIIEIAADRWALEEQFHDAKEIWGAGQQQVRNVWSNIGCWHLNQWLFTMVEMSCWDIPFAELTDRSGRPWDNPDRRPSHADRRRMIARPMLERTFSQVWLPDPRRPENRTLLRHLLALAS